MPAGAPNLSATWYARTSDRGEEGPMSYVALAGLVRRGVVCAHDDISSDGRLWQPARSVPGLFDSADAPGTMALRRDQPGTDRHRPGTARLQPSTARHQPSTATARRASDPHPGAGIPGTGSHTRQPGTARFADSSGPRPAPSGSKGGWGVIIAVIAVLALGAGGFIWWKSRPHPIMGTWDISETLKSEGMRIKLTGTQTFSPDGTLRNEITVKAEGQSLLFVIEADYFINDDKLLIQDYRLVKWPNGASPQPDEA